jgi:predicted nucleotidyltransferase
MHDLTPALSTVLTHRLEAMAAEHQIQILLAVESGSRAWGFASPDSDYDVRFLYLKPLHWYLSLQEKYDTIELPISEDLDISGWDIRKGLYLLSKSNPVVCEWIFSPTIYTADEKWLPILRDVAQQSFSPRAGLHHYLGMAHKHWELIQAETHPRIKTYFYALRSTLAATWIALYKEIPPVAFQQLVTLLETETDLLSQILTLFEHKQEHSEKATIERLDPLDGYLHNALETAEALANTVPKQFPDYALLDATFARLLKIS